MCRDYALCAVVGFSVLMYAHCLGKEKPDSTTDHVAYLDIVCVPPGSRLTINNVFHGSVGQPGPTRTVQPRRLALGPGTYLIELWHEGYYAHYTTLSVKRGERRRLNVTLDRQLFSTDAFSTDKE